MRSRAEWALRVAALLALILLIRGSMRPVDSMTPVVVARGGLERALVYATRRPVAALAVELDSVPGPVHRDWLASVRAAGTEVAWRGRDLPPIAIAASRVAEPEARVRVVVAAAESASVVLSDRLGAIDTMEVRNTSASRLLRTGTGALAASTAGVRATATTPAPVPVRRVLVLAAAGWESKFVVTALEEAGWTVDARIRVAPGVESRQGGELMLDTSRYSAVVALDAVAAANAGAIDRFVSSGGGVILAGAVTRLPAFARITSAAATASRVAGSRSGLVLGGLRSDAVVLEAQGGRPLVVARRSGHGRVIASGYDETWKWRMQRAAEAPAAHREWWTALVSAVAYAPSGVPTASPTVSDPAPVAALTAALGQPSALEETPAGRIFRIPPTWLLFGVLLVSILAEVGSRRFRGRA